MEHSPQAQNVLGQLVQPRYGRIDRSRRGVGDVVDVEEDWARAGDLGGVVGRGGGHFFFKTSFEVVEVEKKTNGKKSIALSLCLFLSLFLRRVLLSVLFSVRLCSRNRVECRGG